MYGINSMDLKRTKEEKKNGQMFRALFAKKTWTINSWNSFK